MKKYKIEYCYIQSDHPFASPTLHHDEIVEVDGVEKLDEYITKQKDDWGHSFEKKKSFGFDYISKRGGVKVKEVKIKKI